MSHFGAKSDGSSALIRGAAVLCVAGLHLAVIGAIVSASSQTEISLPESTTIQFVEIGPEFIDTAIDEEIVEAAASEEVEPEPEPEITEPEPAITEPEPEPEITEPKPEPEPIIEEPEPEPVIEEPTPEAITPEPAPEPRPEPKPKPEPKPQPEPKPKPKPTPKPRPKPRPVPAPVKPDATPAPASGAADQVAKPEAPQASPDPNTPRLVGNVDYLGRRPMPDYPRASLRRGETGRVVVRVLISPQGSVADASIQRSSGHSRLDDSALTAARKARFKPYTENGVAYPALADIPFDFVL